MCGEVPEHLPVVHHPLPLLLQVAIDQVLLEGQGADVLQGGGAQVGGGGGGGHAAVGRAEDQAPGGPGRRGARLDQHLGRFFSLSQVPPVTTSLSSSLPYRRVPPLWP